MFLAIQDAMRLALAEFSFHLSSLMRSPVLMPTGQAVPQSPSVAQVSLPLYLKAFLRALKRRISEAPSIDLREARSESSR